MYDQPTDIDPPMPEPDEAYLRWVWAQRDPYYEVLWVYRKVMWEEAWAWAVEDYMRENTWARPWRRYFEQLGR